MILTLGIIFKGGAIYGASANWADDYFVIDLTDLGLGAIGHSGLHIWLLKVGLQRRCWWNTPISDYLSNSLSAAASLARPGVMLTQAPLPSHGTPIDFYLSTINGTAFSCAAGYGFPLSIEDGGSGAWMSHPANNPPLPLCGTASLSQNQQPVRSDAPFVFSVTPYDTSSSGVSFLGSGGASLTSDAPAWLAVGVTVTNAVNFVQFDAGLHGHERGAGFADGVLEYESSGHGG